MKKILQAMVLAVAVGAGVGGLVGCSQDKARQQQSSTDPVIKHYLQRRSDLVAQRRHLAETYGPNSPQVADVDRQIALVDNAADRRRTQLIEEEHARQQVRQMKSESAAEGSLSSQPSTQPAK
jgi:uncharacterized protein involved in exopolysaccharide biosynthesis